jgi:putative ABC transport system permease protein
MWSKNLKSFIKHLLNNKLYTVITVFGFAISLMFVILLSIYVKKELSVDQFHENKDRLYRLVREDNSGFAPPVGERLLLNYPEIESYTRIYMSSGVVTISGDKKLRIDFLMADSAFFTMFSFDLIEGDPARVLETRNGIVLARSFANKAFGDESPIGREVSTIDDRNRFIVTGIMEDIPDNTHFQPCDAVLNFRALADLWGWEDVLTFYGVSSFGHYFLARPGTDLPSKAPMILEEFKKDYWIFKEGRYTTLNFESVTECYFSSSYSPGIRRNNKKLIMIFSVIVILILVLAIINYINLTVSQAGFRGKEAAIRKILGSSKRLLVQQFILESIILCFISYILAIVFSLITEPGFNNLLNTRLYLEKEFTIRFFLVSSGFLLLIGCISGIVPSLVISRFIPVEIVKGSLRKKTKSYYSKVLISFQYVISITLLICTWMIVRQTRFFQNRDPGFNKENLIEIENDIPNNRRNAFRDLMECIAGVERVAFVGGSPLDGGNNQSWVYEGKPLSFQELIVDSAFLEMMEFEIIPTGAAYDRKGMYLNETAVKVLELDSLPTSFKRYAEERPVLGVVKDFHFENLYEPIGPVMIGQMNPDQYAWSIFIQINDQNILQTVNKIKEAYKNYTGGISMKFEFVDETIQQWYQQEENTVKIVGFFSILAIIIAISGIFAMASYFIQQRQKDIGIRKVNGATSGLIMGMLSFDFLKWVILAFVISCPISWFAINKWLQKFAYKTNFPWWVFLLTGLIALAVAFLSISFQSWRAARLNPANSLRYE